MTPLHDTIAAPATPNGTAGIAVLRVSGPDTVRLVTEIFGATPPPRRLRHADYRDRVGALVDDVMVVVFAGPHSYTGEDAMEVSCHGNPFIVQRIFEDLLARGCRAAEPGEFTRRAFLNGRIDLSQAEAVVDVIHARSERALAAANRQLRGALGRRADEVMKRLVQVVAQVEAYIDFPDEDLPAENRQALRDEIGFIALKTNELLATNHYGEMLREGIRVAILGAPNVGKSSMLNRFLGRERALVSAEPGTTRDFIEERVIIGPHCFRLIDTAGLNAAPAELERLGMAKTMERAAEADILLLVTDASLDSPSLPADLGALVADPRVIRVANKIDRGGVASRAARDAFVGETETVRVSALTGTGWDSLERALVRKADSYQPDAGETDIAISARHAQALTQAREALRAAEAKLARSEAAELVASDLRDALAAWGEIGGRVDHEQVLDALFASFCIGK